MRGFLFRLFLSVVRPANRVSPKRCKKVANLGEAKKGKKEVVSHKKF
jgi:hypothetical protein